jgi:cysteinyl-tRNA synthetase
MSKSLKNFVTIKECLQKYSARQMRFMFLQHQWNAPVTYKESSMVNAMSAESAFVNFLTNLGQHCKEYVEPGNGNNNFMGAEKALLGIVEDTKSAVHAALCDSFDTPSALSALLDLVNKCNVYMKSKGRLANPNVLRFAANYLTKILSVFGISGLPHHDGYSQSAVSGMQQSTGLTADRLQGILDSIGRFRDSVRSIAKNQQGTAKDYFTASDSLRNELAKVGVVFEDRADGLCSLVKLVDPNTAANTSGESVEDIAKKTAAMTLKQQQAERAASKLSKARIHPSDMFKGNPLYSKLDEKGIPTHDASGEELSKSARKKAVKEYEQQAELYAKHISISE